MEEKTNVSETETEKVFRYDAFISYRHLNPDQKVATNLHKMLEAFKLPKAYCQQNDRKKKSIDRVFRDQEELPLAQNLTDPINEALASTEWLIVICSTKLQLSIWCQKEIETFLELRGRQYILVALVDGSPIESIPRNLWPKELQSKSDLTEEEQKRLYDVDFRVENEKLLEHKIKDEYYRILGPMFSIKQEELKDKVLSEKHRRKIRRYFLGMAMLLVLAVYVLFLSVSIRMKNTTIARQYEELKTDEMILMARQSTEAMESDDRETATRLAYQSLTTYDTIKPDEGRYALFESLDVYDTGTKYKERYRYECGNKIEYLYGSEQYDFVLIYDDTRTVTCLDYKTGEVRYTISDVNLKNKEEAVLTENGYFVYKEQDGIRITYAETNEEVKKIPGKTLFREYEDNIYIVDSNRIDCFFTDMEKYVTAYYELDASITNLEDLVYVDTERIAYRNMGFISVKGVGDSSDGTEQGYQSYLEAIIMGQDPLSTRAGMVSLDSLGRHTQECLGACFVEGYLYLIITDLNTRLDEMKVSKLPATNGDTILYKMNASKHYQSEDATQILLPAKHITGICGSDGKHYLVYYSDYAARISDLKMNRIYIENFSDKLMSVEEADGGIYFTCINGDTYRLSPVLEECGPVLDNSLGRRIDRNSKENITQIVYAGDYQLLTTENSNCMYVFSRKRSDGLEEISAVPVCETASAKDEVKKYLSDNNLVADNYYGEDSEENHYFSKGSTGYIISGMGGLIGEIEDFAGVNLKEMRIYLMDENNVCYSAPIYPMDMLLQMGNEQMTVPALDGGSEE